MLRSVSEIIGYNMAATDGQMGKAHDFLFDDQEWTIRYLVADTGKWLSGRKVLIAPKALGEADWEKQLIQVSLTKEKIENSPSVDADKPVSRQQEIALHRYYVWAPYWAGGIITGPSTVAVPEEPDREVSQGDSHLRSVKHVKGYHVSAADGDIGHIDDFVVEDATWIIRYAVVNTQNWLPGKKVLVSPWWVKDINWSERKAGMGLKREDIKKGPHYDPALPVNREYEERLYDFHGRPKYWAR